MRLEFLAILLAATAVTVFGIQFNLYHYTATQNLALASDMTSFSGTLAWVKSAGYFVMFIAMVIEGPIVTAAAAFAAALGYFNIFAVLIISILGDLTGDFIYYGIGYFGRVSFVEKYGHKVGLTAKRIGHMERLIKTHPKKTIAAIKLAPMLPAPGLMMIGAIRMRFKDYTLMTLLVALPKTILFMLLGYYFGETYDTIAHYLQNGQSFILIAIVATIIAYYVYKKIAAKVSVQLEAI